MFCRKFLLTVVLFLGMNRLVGAVQPQPDACESSPETCWNPRFEQFDQKFSGALGFALEQFFTNYLDESLPERLDFIVQKLKENDFSGEGDFRLSFLTYFCDIDFDEPPLFMLMLGDVKKLNDLLNDGDITRAVKFALQTYLCQKAYMALLKGDRALKALEKFLKRFNGDIFSQQSYINVGPSDQNKLVDDPAWFFALMCGLFELNCVNVVVAQKVQKEEFDSMRKEFDAMYAQGRSAYSLGSICNIV